MPKSRRRAFLAVVAAMAACSLVNLACSPDSGNGNGAGTYGASECGQCVTDACSVQYSACRADIACNALGMCLSACPVSATDPSVPDTTCLRQCPLPSSGSQSAELFQALSMCGDRVTSGSSPQCCGSSGSLAGPSGPSSTLPGINGQAGSTGSTAGTSSSSAGTNGSGGVAGASGTGGTASGPRCTASGPGKCGDTAALNHCNCGAYCYRDSAAAGSSSHCHFNCKTDDDCKNLLSYPTTCQSYVADTGTTQKECRP